ncbi:MAG: hypothetical protein MJ252_01280, partial [archaeon]|nr:hypothetical protein [archaeon]
MVKSMYVLLFLSICFTLEENNSKLNESPIGRNNSSKNITLSRKQEEECLRENGTCVDHCSEANPYNLNQTCVSSCKDPMPYYLDYTCVESCVGTHKPFSLDHTCVESCEGTNKTYKSDYMCVDTCNIGNKTYYD